MEDFDYGRDWSLALPTTLHGDGSYEFGHARDIASMFKTLTGIDAKAVIERGYVRIMVQCDQGWCWLDMYRGRLIEGHMGYCPIVGTLEVGEWDSIVKWELWNAKYQVRVKERELRNWQARMEALKGGAA